MAMSGEVTTTDLCTGPGRVRWTSHLLSLVIALGAGVYFCAFWVKVRPRMPDWMGWINRTSRTLVLPKIVQAIEAMTGWEPTGRWTWAVVSLVLGAALPWLIMALIGRGRPRDIGLRWPNRVGYRLVIVGYLASLPFLVWMAWSPKVQAFYQRELAIEPWTRLYGPHVIVLFAEHLMFHGILLAALRPGRRWPVVPTPVPAEGPALRRVLRWLGLAQPTGDARGLVWLTRWIGLPDACVWAMVLQTALFGLVHAGKPPAELAMSFPGGLAMAYVAYRCNGWLVPLVLHTATAVTVLALVWLWSP